MTEFVKDLDNFIKESLTGFYSKHSFQPEKTFNGFFLNVDGSVQKVLIGPSAEYDARACYSPGFRVINEQLEKSKTQFLKGNMVPGGSLLCHAENHRLALQFGANEHNGWIDYKVENKTDATTMIRHHEEFMDKAGWKFFKLTSTIEGINKFLNTRVLNSKPEIMSNDDKITFIRETGAGWLVNGIVSAWLTKEQDFNKLVSNYRAIYFPAHIQTVLNILLEGME